MLHGFKSHNTERNPCLLPLSNASTKMGKLVAILRIGFSRELEKFSAGYRSAV